MKYRFIVNEDTIEEFDCLNEALQYQNGFIACIKQILSYKNSNIAQDDFWKLTNIKVKEVKE